MNNFSTYIIIIIRVILLLTLIHELTKSIYVFIFINKHIIIDL